jgi:hypothetical protein
MPLEALGHMQDALAVAHGLHGGSPASIADGSGEIKKRGAFWYNHTSKRKAVTAVKQIAIDGWADMGRLTEEEREELAFGEAVLLFPSGTQYRREIGPRLDMHFVIDLGGDESHVHDLFVNVSDPADLYCLRCGAIDGRRLEEAYQRHLQESSS